MFIIPVGKLRKRELVCLKLHFPPGETAIALKSLFTASLAEILPCCAISSQYVQTKAKWFW